MSALDKEDVRELFRYYAVLLRAKGSAVTNEDIHDTWAAWMAGRDTKHRALRPYAELDAKTRAEDVPYR
jgi:hypothetical protein